jgi:hypothetical protein
MSGQLTIGALASAAHTNVPCDAVCSGGTPRDCSIIEDLSSAEPAVSCAGAASGRRRAAASGAGGAGAGVSDFVAIRRR